MYLVAENHMVVVSKFFSQLLLLLIFRPTAASSEYQSPQSVSVGVGSAYGALVTIVKVHTQFYESVCGTTFREFSLWYHVK